MVRYIALLFVILIVLAVLFLLLTDSRKKKRMRKSGEDKKEGQKEALAAEENIFDIYEESYRELERGYSGEKDQRKIQFERNDNKEERKQEEKIADEDRKTSPSDIIRPIEEDSDTYKTGSFDWNCMLDKNSEEKLSVENTPIGRPLLEYEIIGEEDEKSGIIYEKEFPCIVGREKDKCRIVIKGKKDASGRYLIGRTYLKIDYKADYDLFRIERKKEEDSHSDDTFLIRNDQGKLEFVENDVFEMSREIIMPQYKKLSEKNLLELHLSRWQEKKKSNV